MATYPKAFYDLVKNIKSYDGIIASRGIKGAKVDTSITRKLTNRGFNLVVRMLFLFPYQDTQCGAKVFKKEVIEKINPMLRITEWAFDINLLYLCKKFNYKIKEYPTDWEDKKGSQMLNIPRITIEMVSGAVRLRAINSVFEPLLRQIKFLLKFANKIIKK